MGGHYRPFHHTWEVIKRASVSVIVVEHFCLFAKPYIMVVVTCVTPLGLVLPVLYKRFVGLWSNAHSQSQDRVGMRLDSDSCEDIHYELSLVTC